MSSGLILCWLCRDLTDGLVTSIYNFLHLRHATVAQLECISVEDFLIVFRAKVTSTNRTETYVGLTATTSKQGFETIKCRLTMKRANDTKLSIYIWQLKNKQQHFNIKWKILAKAKPYSNLTKRCTTEKHFIITKPATLNKRNELISTCRHRRKFILRYS